MSRLDQFLNCIGNRLLTLQEIKPALRIIPLQQRSRNTSDNVLEHNWFNSGVAQTPNATEHRNQLIGNVQVSGTDWPADAQRVIDNAGIEPHLRTFPGVTP